MTIKSSARVGYLNAILAQGGGYLNKSIFESSNAGTLHGGVGGGGGGDVDLSNRSAQSRLYLSPCILTTVLAGLQCVLSVLFQIWSQECRHLRSEL